MAQWGVTSLLPPSSGTGRKFDGKNMKHIPGPLPQPLLCCCGGENDSTPLCRSIRQRSGSQPGCACCVALGLLCPACGFACGCIPGARASPTSRPPLPCACVQRGGRRSSVPAPSDPRLAFAGGQREENHSPGCDEEVAAAEKRDGVHRARQADQPLLHRHPQHHPGGGGSHTGERPCSGADGHGVSCQGRAWL